ncbi:MAG: YceD family protein [Lachnospirales bacterium]
MEKLHINTIRNQSSLEDKMPIHANLSFLLPQRYTIEKEVFFDAVFDGCIFESGDVYTLEGTLNGQLILPCSKCLDEVSENLSVNVLEKFSNDQVVIDEDEDIVPFENYEIDIEDYLYQNIILNLPTKVLCKEECLGLCNICGGNKNLKDCDCTQESDSVFDDVLKFFQD